MPDCLHEQKRRIIKLREDITAEAFDQKWIEYQCLGRDHIGSAIDSLNQALQQLNAATEALDEARKRKS